VAAEASEKHWRLMAGVLQAAMVGFTVTGGGIVIAGFAGLLAAPVALLLVGAVALALLALALAQGRVALRAAWSAEVAAYNTECLWRLQRLWDRLPEPTVDVPESDRAMSDDLDLFGPRSVFHWLCRAGLPEARRRLRDWMLSPANPEAIRQRQVAARELADRVDLRERLAVETRLLGSGANAVEDFVTVVCRPAAGTRITAQASSGRGSGCDCCFGRRRLNGRRGGHVLRDARRQSVPVRHQRGADPRPVPAPGRTARRGARPGRSLLDHHGGASEVPPAGENS
jgi:hypothetical protein